jgi:hypothetical protein
MSVFEPSYASALASKLRISFTANPTRRQSSLPSKTASPGSTPGLPDSTSPPSESNTLSTGAKAGIGVGVAIGTIALAAVVFFVFASRKRRRSDKNPPPGYDAAADNAPELVQYYDPIHTPDMGHHQHPAQAHELMQNHNPQWQRAELSGNTHMGHDPASSPTPPRELA